MELILESLVAILLLVTVVYCYVLNGRLANLRNSQDEMRQLLDDFAVAMAKAETSVGELRQASNEIGADLQERVVEARSLSDELKVMVQSGDDLANRLEEGLIGRRTETRASEDAETGEGTRSESERELLEALRRAK